MSVHQLNQKTDRENGPVRILRVDASAQGDGSTTRTLSNDLIARLKEIHGHATVTTRDLSQGLPVLDETWVSANSIEPDQRSDAQSSAIELSDRLIAEMRDADILVIGVPVYNFSVPAALKTWIDQVVRPRVTFRYTEAGPEGLLKGKKAYLVAASGGTAVGSEIDFATPYMRYILGFVGIEDVTVIAADRQMIDDTATAKAKAEISELAA